MNSCRHSLKLGLSDFLLLYGFQIEKTRCISKVRFECKECGKSIGIKWKLPVNRHSVFSVLPVILWIIGLVVLGVLTYRQYIDGKMMVFLLPLCLLIGGIGEYLVSMELIKLFTEHGIIAELTEIHAEDIPKYLSKEEAVAQSKKSKQWKIAGITISMALVILLLLGLVIIAGR